MSATQNQWGRIEHREERGAVQPKLYKRKLEIGERIERGSDFVRKRKRESVVKAQLSGYKRTGFCVCVFTTNRLSISVIEIIYINIPSLYDRRRLGVNL